MGITTCSMGEGSVGIFSNTQKDWLSSVAGTVITRCPLRALMRDVCPGVPAPSPLFGRHNFGHLIMELEIFAPAFAWKCYLLVSTKSLPYFGLHLKQRAEWEEEPPAFDGSHEFVHVLGWPFSQLAAFHDVFAHFLPVVAFANVFHLTNREFLPDQTRPRLGQARHVQPVSVQQPVTMHVPTPSLVGYLDRDASAPNRFESFRSPHLGKISRILAQQLPGQHGQIALGKNEMFWLLYL
jgi:hypothetical protein